MSLLNNCTEVAFKFLSSVEIDNYGSNQHEFHGAKAFKQIFGYKRQYLNGTIIYIDSQNRIYSHNTLLTWYDAREESYDRSEFRFYYTKEISVFYPKINNILLISKDNNQNVIVIIIDNSKIINKILKNINLFTSYKYSNGTSYYGDLFATKFLQSII